MRAVAASVGPLSHPLLADVLDQAQASCSTARAGGGRGTASCGSTTHSDGYALRHGLMAEVVAADLLPGERIELHRRYAGRDRGRAAGGPALAAQLAHHW